MRFGVYVHKCVLYFLSCFVSSSQFAFVSFRITNGMHIPRDNVGHWLTSMAAVIPHYVKARNDGVHPARVHRHFERLGIAVRDDIRISKTRYRHVVIDHNARDVAEGAL